MCREEATELGEGSEPGDPGWEDAGAPGPEQGRGRDLAEWWGPCQTGARLRGRGEVTGPDASKTSSFLGKLIICPTYPSHSETDLMQMKTPLITCLANVQHCVFKHLFNPLSKSRR